jgi:hypothetical protein
MRDDKASQAPVRGSYTVGEIAAFGAAAGETHIQDSRTNRRAGWREGGFSGERPLSVQCVIDIAFVLDAAARQASPGFGVCNHRESGVR